MDRARVEELEVEVTELREYNTTSNKEINRLRRENNALLMKLSRYESRVENERHREAGERRAAAEHAQAFARQREALQKVALALNDPSSPTVAELRKSSRRRKQTFVSSCRRPTRRKARRAPSVARAQRDAFASIWAAAAASFIMLNQVLAVSEPRASAYPSCRICRAGTRSRLRQQALLSSQSIG